MIGMLGRGSLAILLLVAADLSDAQSTDSESLGTSLEAERFQILTTEAETLRSIAAGLRKAGKTEEAEQVRAFVEEPPPLRGPRRFFPLPEIVPADESKRPQLTLEAQKVLDDSVDALEDLADRAFEARRYAVADAALRGILKRSPDHPEARRLLGFVPHEGGWVTPLARSRLREGEILHPTFGWVPESWLERLEDGLLPAPRGSRGSSRLRWLPAAEADALRQGRIADGWSVTTPHFQIKANVPLADAITLGKRLEAFRDLFISIMADVIGPERLQLARLQRNPSATASPSAGKRHRVIFFGSKAQYNEYLSRRLGPDIVATLGVYVTKEDAARFREQPASFSFQDENAEIGVESTLYHEVSHQLLFELAGRSGFQRNRGHFWIFEGLGTYFETVRRLPDGSLQCGGPVGRRLEAAQDQIINLNRFIPIDAFLTMGRLEFNGQRGESEPQFNYVQAMALTVFLMDGDRGIYRAGLLDYVNDAYDGRLRTGSESALVDAIGIDAEALEKGLRDYLAGPVAR